MNINKTTKTHNDNNKKILALLMSYDHARSVSGVYLVRVRGSGKDKLLLFLQQLMLLMLNQRFLLHALKLLQVHMYA